MTTTTKIVRADHKRMFYNAWSVRRMQAGAKNQTRRVIDLPDWCYEEEVEVSQFWDGTWQFIPKRLSDEEEVHFWEELEPKYKPGATYLVAEPLKILGAEDEVGDIWPAVAYDADSEYVLNDEGLPRHYPEGWTRDHQPAWYCPRKFCRYAVRINDVRVERINDISREDCYAEGIEPRGRIGADGLEHEADPLDAFADKWCDLHGDDAWKRNDWVYVYELSSLIEID